MRVSGRFPVLCLALLLLTLIAGCQKAPEKPTPKASDKPVAVAPTARPKPTAAVTPVDLICGGDSGRVCQLSMLSTEPDDGVAPLVNALNAARVSIDYVPFELDDKRIAAALADAQRRGVKVRVLLEPSPGGDLGTSYSATTALVKAGIQSRDANPAFSLTHAKYAIIDGERTLMLTFNSTSTDFATRRDFAILDEDREDARFVQSLFDADWNRTSLASVPPGFVVSPDNSNTALVSLVNSATRTLDVYAEKLLASPLLDAILNAARRGVNVRILAGPASDTKGATRDRIIQTVRTAQLQVHIPRSPRIHAKILAVDGATLFLGSENVQDAPRERRRELGFIFQESTIAERIEATFERDWLGSFDPLD